MNRKCLSQNMEVDFKGKKSYYKREKVISNIKFLLSNLLYIYKIIVTYIS